MVNKFALNYQGYFKYLPARIPGNCIILPIEVASQDTDLRIFSTLNNCGLSLSDADIFEVEFYKFYKGKGKRDDFIDKWKALEEICKNVMSL